VFIKSVRKRDRERKYRRGKKGTICHGPEWDKVGVVGKYLAGKTTSTLLWTKEVSKGVERISS